MGSETSTYMGVTINVDEDFFECVTIPDHPSYSMTCFFNDTPFIFAYDGVIVQNYGLSDPEYMGNLVIASEFYKVVFAYAYLRMFEVKLNSILALGITSKIDATEARVFLKYTKEVKPHSKLFRYFDLLYCEQRLEYLIKSVNGIGNFDKYRGYVYLVQSPTEYYKIGRSKDPDNRMKTFSVKLPFEVEYLHLIPTNHHVRLEKELHDKFSYCRADGEWFALSNSDVEYIQSIVLVEYENVID